MQIDVPESKAKVLMLIAELAKSGKEGREGGRKGGREGGVS